MIGKVIVAIAVMAAAVDAACYPLGLPATGCLPAVSPCSPLIPDVASLAAVYSAAAVPSCLSPLGLSPYGYPGDLSLYGSPFAAPYGVSSCLPGLGAAPYYPAITGCF